MEVPVSASELDTAARKTLQTYLEHHQPREEELVAVWIDRTDRAEHIIVLEHRADRPCGKPFAIAGFPQSVGHWGHQLGGLGLTLEQVRIGLAKGDLLGISPAAEAELRGFLQQTYGSKWIVDP